MTDELKDLLNRVASGELSPEDAQAQLQATTPAPRPTPGQEPPAEPVERVVVRGSAVRLTVVGDPTVATAVAEGPHRVSHVGHTLTIHSDLSSGDYETEVPRSAFATWLTTVNRAGASLVVRINPNLPVEVLNVAGSLELSGIRAQASVGVEVGSAKVHDGSGPLALSVASGSADVDWQFHGDSSVSTDLGSARVHVMSGSDVAIRAEATLGMASIRLGDGSVIKASPNTHPPVVVGSGAGHLAVTSRLGSVVITVE